MDQPTIRFDSMTFVPYDDTEHPDALVGITLFQDKLPHDAPRVRGVISLDRDVALHIVGLLQAIIDGKDIA